MPPAAIDTMLRWCNRGNPSGAYASGVEARRLLAKFRHYIAAECDIQQEGPDGYAILFTSGASEANCHIITAAARSYTHRTGLLPHIVTSAAEHPSVRRCCARLARERLCQLTTVSATHDRYFCQPDSIYRAIRKNTCLVTVAAANPETGAINDLRAIGAAVRRGSQGRVPFHTDAAQLFGKSAFRPRMLKLDAFSVSFHMLHGPPGVGLLCIKNKLIEGYDLCPLICGMQNAGLRGGIENLPGIAGSFAALRHTLKDRRAKNARLRACCAALTRALRTALVCLTLDEYLAHRGTKKGQLGLPGRAAVVFFGPSNRAKVLPGTISLAVVQPGSARRFCNETARAALEARGVIVSLGSSYFLEAAGAPEKLHAGALHLGLSDEITLPEVGRLAQALLEVLQSDECFVR